MSAGISEFLRRYQPAPLTPENRARIIASLPAQGELVPTRTERAKLAALDPVLDFHRRQGGIDLKVVDVGYAFVGVHGRAVLLITREALALVNAAELQAIGAHELAHEYFWDDYEAALKGQAYERLQELELRCDGMAVITLRALGSDPAHLVHAAAKVTRHNERTRAISTTRQVSLEARLAFIKKVDARLRAYRQ